MDQSRHSAQVLLVPNVTADRPLHAPCGPAAQHGADTAAYSENQPIIPLLGVFIAEPLPRRTCGLWLPLSLWLIMVRERYAYRQTGS